jgi:hypothetical protein
MFHNFLQGDLSVSDYCHKMKSMALSLGNLGCMFSGRNLILNVLRGLNKWYDHLWVIIMRITPFLTFHMAQDELVLKEIMLSPNVGGHKTPI